MISRQCILRHETITSSVRPLAPPLATGRFYWLSSLKRRDGSERQLPPPTDATKTGAGSDNRGYNAA